MIGIMNHVYNSAPAQGTPIESLADSLAASTEADRLAIILMRAWGRADPNSDVARHPVSFVATFKDMAHAALTAVEQGVTAERPGCCQGWEWTPSGVVDENSRAERYDQEPCPYSADTAPPQRP